ncbi:hypothetical protein EUGRSUZ_C02579 [Eucalyptus grandis]|uniref:Uncharacterized protein n=2 Tax=Eucalyptus grandis TaxID=71139 RepID=A0A059CS51_EUCGR|nr:hypothetical protein EUGRSUZ_C02579 [Eucalyptus grandis]
MALGDNDNHQSPEWVVEIKNCLDGGLAPDAKSPWTIGKVPGKWSRVHDSAFHGEMVDIGPFDIYYYRERSHIHRPSFHSDLPVGRDLKMRFLLRLLGGKLERRGRDGDVSRTTEGQRASDGCERDEHDDGGRIAMLLDHLAEAMQILEQKTRACYSESFNDRSSEEFVEMMVVDGCFVVELLRLYHQRFNPQSPGVATEYDPIFTNPRTLTALRRDLLLLENQLPFFVLEKLYELINKNNKIDHQHAVPLEVLAVTFFDPLLPQHNAASKLDTNKPKAHLLDVFRSTFLKSVSEKVLKKGKSEVESRLNPNGSMRGLVRHFASELQEAGMQFKKRKGHDLLDIEFDHNTLRVPQLSIDDNTISLLLNFVAYEMSVQHPEPFFTNYLMFWDSLINSPRDIQIFRKRGIINHLGSENEAAELLVKCRELNYDLDLGYLYNEIKEVNEYCEQYYGSKYSVWWRSLIRERFSSPWTCLSLFAVIILLLLTLLQTFYTVYAYYRPH